MPLAQRAVFWAALIGWNMVKWHLWFAFTMRGEQHRIASALAGAVLLNLLLPVEIRLILSAFGITSSVSFWTTFTMALAISCAIALVVFPVVARIHASDAAAPQSAAAATAIPPGGLLERAGVIDPELLLAIEAQDHYLRLTLADGRAPLIHCRFADALEEVRALDGAQVRRGTWVAARAIDKAERVARSWRLTLCDGSEVTVSASYVGMARKLGWLRN